jgi:hypothetical protein
VDAGFNSQACRFTRGNPKSLSQATVIEAAFDTLQACPPKINSFTLIFTAPRCGSPPERRNLDDESIEELRQIAA